MNVGVIQGGTSVNTIASRAWLELDLRSEGEKLLAKLAQNVEQLVRAAEKKDVSFEIQVIGDRPAGEIAPQHPLVEFAVRVLEEQGTQAELNIGSTDANLPLSRGLPAICIGLTNGGGAHTQNEFIHTDKVEDGLQQLLKVVQGAFEVL
jgi:di/tripeptidase